MSFINSIYQNTLAENDRNLRFWEDYVRNLQALDFSVYSDKLKVQTLVPLGSRILFRGEIKHTNEVTVSLGADYFTKCSVSQAEVLRHHRIKDAQSRVDAFQKEREYLENQLSFTNDIYRDVGQEIIEDYNEEEEQVWRLKHKNNMKLYKQKKGKSDCEEKDATDEELWERLEELELKEELENEMNNLNETLNGNEITEKFAKLESSKNNTFAVEKKVTQSNETGDPDSKVIIKNESSNFKEDKNANAKLQLLQKVIKKQNELEEKLNELKYKERCQSKSEEALIAKLDEMEEIDDLEDEMDRLENVLENENVTEESAEEDQENDKLQATVKTNRRVSFADEDEGETLQLTFKHSDINPKIEPYDPEKGITKPSDIYEAHASRFQETKSILKKNNYGRQIQSNAVSRNPKKPTEMERNHITDGGRTIVVRDVEEKIDKNDRKVENLESKSRPSSLFKMRRQNRNFEN